MANLSKVIYINEEDYSTLLNGGTITKGGVTYSHDPTALYVIKNVSAPEYAETAGYATTAGQATKATQDGNGDVISETYEKEQQVIIEFEISGNGIIFTNLEDSEVREICNDSSKTVLLMDVGNPGMDNECAVYYRSVFATDYWIFSSTSTMWSGGSIIVFYWDDNHEIINLRSSSDLFPTENVDFGQAYGISSNNANSAARTSSISKFELKKGGIVAIKFTTDIDITNPSLNISSTGSKPIYYRGSALPRGTVNAGDTVTFIYDGTYYHIISIDKDIPAPATTAPIMDGTATIGTSDKYAKEDHVHPKDTTKQDRLPSFITWMMNTFGIDLLFGEDNFPRTEADAQVLTEQQVAALNDNANTNWSFIDSDNTDIKNYTLIQPVVQSSSIHSWSAVTSAGIYTFSIKTHDTTDDTSWYEQSFKPFAYSTDLATVATSGSYNDLSNKPTIPTVNDGTLTIKQNGISRGTFTANQSGSSEADIKSIVYGKQVSGNFRKGTLSGSTWSFLSSNLTLEEGVLYIDVETKKVYYYDGTGLKETYSPNLSPYANVQADWNETDDTSDAYIWNKPTIPDTLKVGSVAGKLYRNNVGGSGNFSISGNSGCIPNLTAGTFLVSIYAKSATQSYTFRFNFGSSVTYDLSTTNGEISDVRQITIPSNGTFSGSVLNSSVASGTILYVVMYDYLTPVNTVGIAAVTNRYADLDGTPNIPTVNNGTLTIQQNGITVGTFTANQSSNTTANIYSTMFGTLGQNGFERDNYNSSTGTWAGVEVVTPNPLVTYVDILSDKLYRYNPLTSGYVELSEGDLSTITSTAITDLTDIL